MYDRRLGPFQWKLEDLWEKVSIQTLNRINDDVKGLVIGGGGLFLRDTNANQNSGWEWNCSIENLRKIDVPIIVFAVGFNRFRGQEDFDPIFRSHLQELVQKSAFFGKK